jgi:mannose-6-phosphate isomerase-like protein (cupin superfamily)
MPDGIEGWSYGSKEVSPVASASLITIDGRHSKTKSLVSDRVFYVLEGEGEFIIGDEAFTAGPTDVLICPKNTSFECNGKMKYFLVHVPAYNYDREVRLE